MDIVVDGGLIVLGSVLLAFVFNQGAKLLGLEFSELSKKLIVFSVAVGLTGYSALKGGVTVPAGDPFETAVFVLGFATSVFKVAQSVYDRLWRPLSEAK
jgi:hypothetical protein